ncbi:hypothetical protein IFM89_007296 [Coptis chinensis]|uniref:Protein NDR1-like n=1 Tax=Coptis chinensis TaxID=261450 RepID=A0A835LB95_9MAGN|nr:hypothetical protein IFM89_007296 [Coptis chinensis]
MANSSRGSHLHIPGFIFNLSLAIFFLCFGLVCSDPVLSIEEIYVPALDKTSNDTENTTIFFDIKFNNRDDGSESYPKTYYDTLNVTIYYAQNLNVPVGNVTIPGFRQGTGRTTYRKETVRTVGVPWETAYYRGF